MRIAETGQHCFQGDAYLHRTLRMCPIHQRLLEHPRMNEDVDVGVKLTNL